MDKEEFLISKLNSAYIGDDGAVIGKMIYSADAFCEGSHFLREWMTPYQIGRKAMLVNISDAVAMNAEPKYALVMLSIPKDMLKEEIKELLRGLESTARDYKCEIIGGDTVGGERLHIGITIISKSDKPLYRTGLEAGDLLIFTGELGESAKDLQKLMSGKKIDNNSKFFEPVLRYDFIRKARDFIRAGMDISDGLFCDTNKMLKANRKGLKIIEDIDKERGLGGEEYEMLIAVPPKNLSNIKKIAEDTNTPLTIFGKIEEGSFTLPCQSHHF